MKHSFFFAQLPITKRGLRGLANRYSFFFSFFFSFRFPLFFFPFLFFFFFFFFFFVFSLSSGSIVVMASNSVCGPPDRSFKIQQRFFVK